MLEQLHETLREIGDWTGDASVGRGAVTVAGAIAAIGFGAWRWLRAKVTPKKRTRINIDCEPGEKVLVQLGDDDAEEGE